MFNFTLNPTEFHNIKVGTIFVDLPIYNDLLGEEYDVLESTEREEMVWNDKLLTLTETIAAERDLSMWEMAKLLNKAETAPLEEKMELLGNRLNDFLRVLSERPLESNKLYKLVQVMLLRVDGSVTLDAVKKLPRSFLRQVYDFCLQEQAGGSYIPRAEVESKLMMLDTEVGLLRDIAAVVSDSELLKANPVLERAVRAYLEGIDNMGKDDMPTIAVE